MDLTNVSNQRRWTIVGLLFSASLINYLDRAAISFALPQLSRDFHLTPESKGLLLSSFFWSYALMQVPIGWCADRFNLRWLYAGAFALWSLAQGLTGLAESLTVLIGFRILLGVGESIYLPGGTKIVTTLFAAKERGLPSGLFDFGTRTGLVLEGILVPWLLVHHGWRYTFLLLGFTGLLWVIPWLLIFPRHMRPVSRAVASPPSVTPSPIHWSALLNRNLLGICLGFLITTGTCWSRGCPTTSSPSAISPSFRPAFTRPSHSSPLASRNRLEDGSQTPSSAGAGMKPAPGRESSLGRSL